MDVAGVIDRAGLPRYQMRGPIEAGQGRPLLCLRQAFRAIKCAVPLKPRSRIGGAECQLPFRAIKCAVPLKQGDEALGYYVRASFRAI